MKRFFVYLFVVFSLAICCDELYVIEPNDVPYTMPLKGTIDETTRLYDSILLEDGYYHDKPISIGVQNVIKRVNQFMNATWTPFTPVPKYPNGYYQAGMTVKGIPYSFGADSDGIVGIDISMYSFMTATLNPYSFFYTEDIRKAPYTGILPGPYYGVVCSSAVAYFLGMDFQYVTYLLDTCPWLVRLPAQDPNLIRVGDVIWQENHVMLVYDIARDSLGCINRITIAEGNEPVTRFFSLSYTDYLKRWEDRGWIIYCYTEIDNTSYEPCLHIPLKGEETVADYVVSNLCTARGDKVCFREGDCVVINSIFSPNVNVSVFKDNLYWSGFQTKNHFLDLGTLPYGDYTVVENNVSDNQQGTSFAVINHNVVLAMRNDDYLKVSFSSENATASYVAFCNNKYRYISVFPLSKDDIQRGYVLLPVTEKECYCRVFFDGKYGRISSKLQKIPI